MFNIRSYNKAGSVRFELLNFIELFNPQIEHLFKRVIMAQQIFVGDW